MQGDRGSDLGRDLDKGYLRVGSPGLQAFIAGRVANGDDLSRAVHGDPARYGNLNAKLVSIEREIPRMEAAFLKLARLYPKTIFPPIYFVVGKGRSGGTWTPAGIVIAIEMDFNEGAGAVVTAVHELVHAQQRGTPTTLLDRSLMEGGADFVAELVTGMRPANLNAPMRLSEAQKQTVLTRFQREMHGTGTGNWLYNADQATKAWPSDLGYWVGYEACRKLYRESLDKTRTLAEILEVTDYLKLWERSKIMEP